MDSNEKITTPGAPPTINLSTISLTNHNFSTKTNSVLGEIWCNTSTGEVRIGATLEKINKAIGDMMNELSALLPSSAKVVGQGGVIMRTTLAQHRRNPRLRAKTAAEPDRCSPDRCG